MVYYIHIIKPICNFQVHVSKICAHKKLFKKEPNQKRCKPEITFHQFVNLHFTSTTPYRMGYLKSSYTVVDQNMIAARRIQL